MIGFNGYVVWLCVVGCLVGGYVGCVYVFYMVWWGVVGLWGGWGLWWDYGFVLVIIFNLVCLWYLIVIFSY